MSLAFSGYQTQSTRFQDDLEASASDVLGATARQTISELPLVSVARMAELGNAQLTGQRVDAANARQRIADAGLDGRLSVGDEGMTSEALDILIERKRDEIKRQEVLNRAPGGFGMGAAQLGTAFAASLLDPVNIGLAFVPVVGEARYLRYLANARGVLGRTAVRAGVGAVEGAAGAALIEPLVYAAKSQEQADYDFTDSLLNVAFGTVFGGGLHAVAGGVGDAAKALRESRAPAARIEPTVDGVRAADLERPMEPIIPAEPAKPGTAASRANSMPLPQREAALRTAVAQAMEGRSVDVEPIINAASQSVAVTPGQIVGYTTAKGSTYEIGQDGTTTRNKAARPEHPGDYGPQPASDRTFYIAPEHAEALGEFQAKGVGKKSVVVSSDGRAGVRYEEGPGAGKIERRTVVPISNEPSIGAIPVELWNGGTRVHFGNEITELRRAPDVRAEARAAADRQSSTESDVTADARASSAADQQLADSPPVADEIAAHEQAIADQLTDLKDTARIAGIDLSEELAEFDELIAQAETYGKAARAAALCGIGH